MSFSFSKIIEAFFSNASADHYTDIFIVLTLIVFIIAIFQACKNKHSIFIEHAPNVMTSLGILGTFVGIVIGLLQFNPNAIDTSISLLLEGLQTAFITSLVGMLSSIIFKSLDTWYFAPRREKENEPESAKTNISIKDLYNELHQQTTLLNELKESLAGNEAGSINGQLKNLRLDLNDTAKKREEEHQQFSENLWKQMDEFAKMLSKSATEQVIEALKQVIVEFNQKLTEQFGDNFKKLDESVKKLVDWQDNYKNQLEAMNIQYEAGVKAISATKDAVSIISDKTSLIPDLMAKLQPILATNQHQIEELKNHLEVFVDMKTAAIQAVPEIQIQVKNIGEQFQQGANEMKTVMLDGASSFKESISKTNSTIEKFSNDILDNSKEIGRSLQQNISEIKDSITTANSTMHKISNDVSSETNNIANILQTSSKKTAQISAEMFERLEKSSKNLQENLERNINNILESIRSDSEKKLSGVSNQIDDAIKRSGDGVNTNLARLDEAIRKELNSVLGELGKSLGGIATKMQDEYNLMQKSHYNIKKALEFNK